MEIPRYTEPQVKTTPISMPQAQALGPEAFGAGIGKGLTDVANTVSTIGQMENKAVAAEKAKQDLAVEADAKNEYITGYNKSILEASQIKGRAVAEGYGESGEKDPGAPDLHTQKIQEFAELRASIEKRLSPDQLALFKSDADRYEREHSNMVLKHQVAEYGKWQDERHATLEDTLNRALITAPDDASFEQGKKDLRSSMDDRYASHDPEAVDALFNKKVSEAQYQRVNNLVLQHPSVAGLIIEKFSKDLTPPQVKELENMKRSQDKVIVSEANDALAKEVMIPAIEKGQFLPDFSNNKFYQTIQATDPTVAATVLKNREAYNSAAAVDKFDTYMTSVPMSKQATMSLKDVPPDVVMGLKEHNPAAYNRVAKNFDDARLLRAEQAAANKAKKEDSAALLLQSFLNPKKVNQEQVSGMIQRGEIDPKLGMGIIKNAQEGGDIQGKLKKTFAEDIDREADALVSGVKEKDRAKAKKKVVATIYDTLSTMYDSTTEVTNESVKRTLDKMRTSSVEEWGLLKNKQVSSLGIPENKTVIIPKEYKHLANMYARKQGITESQAWGIMSAINDAGKDPRKLLLTHEGGM